MCCPGLPVSNATPSGCFTSAGWRAGGQTRTPRTGPALHRSRRRQLRRPGWRARLARAAESAGRPAYPEHKSAVRSAFSQARVPGRARRAPACDQSSARFGRTAARQLAVSAPHGARCLEQGAHAVWSVRGRLDGHLLDGRRGCGQLSAGDMARLKARSLLRVPPASMAAWPAGSS